MNEPTYQASIIKYLTKTIEFLENTNPDGRSNTGRGLGKAFMLRVISDYTDKQYDNEMKLLKEAEAISDPSKLEAGDYVLGESTKFTVTCKVSNPRRAFDADKLALALKKKYKIPEAVTKDLIEKSKSEGSSNKTIKIIER